MVATRGGNGNNELSILSMVSFLPVGLPGLSLSSGLREFANLDFFEEVDSGRMKSRGYGGGLHDCGL